MDFLAALSSALTSHGVDRVFGVPGTQTVPLLEALRREGIRFTLAAHEGGAAFMANGYARAGGGVGVLCTIGGPGFTNALTGLAEARLDSVPILHLVTAPSQGPGRAFRLQAIDQAGIAAPLVKACLRVSESGNPASVLGRAFALASDGEPGPVLLEIDLSANRGDAAPSLAGSRDTGPGAPGAKDVTSWDRLADAWAGASRPLFYLGQGAFEAAELVAALVDRFRIPVLTTPSGRGVLPEGHAQAMCFDPLRGGVELANQLLTRSDLVLAVGCKLSHNGSAGFQLQFPAASLVHVDAEPTVPGANYPAFLGMRAGARESFEFLAESPRVADGEGWSAEELRGFRERLREPAEDPKEPTIAGDAAPAFFTWLRRALPDDAILVTDSGQHQIMTRRHYDVSAPRGLLFPSDFQSMGFGVPAAIGAKHALPERPVAALVGDGGLLMSGMEITGAVRDRLPIPFFVFNDGHLSQIRLHQLSDYGHGTGVDTGRLGVEAFAYAAGANYLRYEVGLSTDSVTKAFTGDRPAVVEVPVGDSPALLGIAAKTRLKEMARGAIGPKWAARIKGWL